MLAPKPISENSAHLPCPVGNSTLKIFLQKKGKEQKEETTLTIKLKKLSGDVNKKDDVNEVLFTWETLLVHSMLISHY